MDAKDVAENLYNYYMKKKEGKYAVEMLKRLYRARGKGLRAAALVDDDAVDMLLDLGCLQHIDDEDAIKITTFGVGVVKELGDMLREGMIVDIAEGQRLLNESRQRRG